MDWKIVKGREEQVKEIAALYARTIDALVEGVNYTGWQRGGYPGEGTAREGVAAGTLYVAQKEGVIGGTVILNHLYEGAYEKGEWAVDCPYSEVFCVHTLVVDPACRGQGIASALTSHLAVEILKRGKVPFYCAAWSNLKSVRNAIKSGFRPSWVEMTAKNAAFVGKVNRNG